MEKPVSAVAIDCGGRGEAAAPHLPSRLALTYCTLSLAPAVCLPG